jgi:hypothetical protein
MWCLILRKDYNHNERKELQWVIKIVLPLIPSLTEADEMSTPRASLSLLRSFFAHLVEIETKQ